MANLVSLRLGDPAESDQRWMIPVLQQMMPLKLKGISIVLGSKPLESYSDEVRKLTDWAQVDEQLVRLRAALPCLAVQLNAKAEIKQAEDEYTQHKHGLANSLVSSLIPQSHWCGIMITTSLETLVPPKESRSY